METQNVEQTKDSIRRLGSQHAIEMIKAEQSKMIREIEDQHELEITKADEEEWNMSFEIAIT